MLKQPSTKYSVISTFIQCDVSVWKIIVTTWKSSIITYSAVETHAGCRCFQRWNELLPCLKPLQSFFLSEVKCPVVLKNFFEDPLSELWVWFIHNQLVLFNAAVLNMEGDNTSVINTTDELQKLTEKLHSRKTEEFISIKVKSKLEELEKKGIATNTFMQALNNFYETAIEYLSLRQASFKPFQQFLWTDLTAVPAWPDIIIIIIIMNFYSPVSNTRCHSIGHKMRIARIKIRVDSPGRWGRA